MTSGRRTICGAFASALLLTSAVSRAESASTQPVDRTETSPAALPAAGSGPREAWLRLDELTLDLGLNADFRRREVVRDYPGINGYRDRQENSLKRFQETMGMKSEGVLFGERVAQYALSARYGLLQEEYREHRLGPDLHQYPDGDLLEYDGRLTLFPAGRLTATGYASKLQDRIPRPFLPSLDRQRERYGADLVFSDATLPMRLTWEKRQERLVSPVRNLLDEQATGDQEVRYEATWHVSETQELRLTYEYNDRREQFSGTRDRFDTTRNFLTLNHVLQFGEDRRSRLEALARFQDETGDFARDQYEVSPQLRLQHTPNLFTTWRGQFLRESYEGIDYTLNRGDASVTHQLGDALTSTLSAYGLAQQREQGGDVDEWGGSGNFSFSKENHLGRFGATLNYNHSDSRTGRSYQDGVVIGEALTLRDPLPAYLARLDANIGSIVVTDSTRGRLYLKGRDYAVGRIGRYTAITRVRTGQIVDGQTVLVTYTYRTNQGFNHARDRVDLRLQQDFKGGVSPYYAGTMQKESFDRQRFLPFESRDISRHRLGVTYRQRRGSATLEYDYNDDRVDPYHAVHLTGDVTFLEKPQHTVAGRAAYSYYRFWGTEQQATRYASLLDLGLDYRFLLGPKLEGNVAAAYRFENDSIRGDTNGVDVSGALEWRLGYFSARFEIEYDLLDLPASSDGNFSAWIKLRREIPVVARRE